MFKEGKIYFKSNVRGLLLTLGKGITPAVFPLNVQATTNAGGYGWCQLDAKADAKKIAAIMIHPLFLSKQVIRVKSPDELAVLVAKHEGKEFAFNLKKSLDTGVLTLPAWDKLDKDKIQQFANQCGISTVKDSGKEFTIKELAEAIESSIVNAVDPGEFDPDADEEEKKENA